MQSDSLLLSSLATSGFAALLFENVSSGIVTRDNFSCLPECRCASLDTAASFRELFPSNFVYSNIMFVDYIPL
jgi:hypothetical protein